jgi:hypothetical protein
MGHGGKREGAGRKKGQPNKKTASIQAKLDKLGCDPIEGMARIAKRAMEEGDMPLAGSMYKELAQYVAPKRKAVEVSGDQENPLKTITSISLVAPNIEP